MTADESAVSGEASGSSPGNQLAILSENPVKRKRNLAGMPGGCIVNLAGC
ncbi:hypothetical protein Hanom_Chr07g00635171 [Helianthus anomalus]